MKILRAAIRAFSLPLVQPIATAHGTLQSRTGFLVSVEAADGRVANGEATPFPEFGTEDLSFCESALKRGLFEWRRRPKSFEVAVLGAPEAETPHGLEEGTGFRLDNRAPCARAALEAAFFDLRAQAQQEPLSTSLRRAAGLSGSPLNEIAVQALVQGTQPEQVAAAAETARAEGFAGFKLKLAVNAERRGIELDLERVAALRSAVGPDASIRLDANEAWTRNEAEKALARFAEFQIDYIEQPVARASLADLAALGATSMMGVAADEALLGAGLAKSLEARAASILIVKPSALGGVSSALSLVRRARADGLRLIWSNLFEGQVGRSVAVSLASATSERDEIHGLGTAGLLAQDFDTSAHGAGLGVGPTEERGGTLQVESLLERSRAIPAVWSDSEADYWRDAVWEAEA